jgi:hypothetical protein
MSAQTDFEYNIDYHAGLSSEIDVERDQSTTPSSTPQEDTSMQPSSPPPTQEPSRTKRHSPNHDFYNDCYSFSPLIYTFFVLVFSLGLWFTVGKTLPSPVDENQLLFLVNVYLAVLVAGDLCKHTPASRTMRVTVWTCCFVFYSATLAFSPFGLGLSDMFELVYPPMCGAILIFAECKLWYANRVTK